MPVSRGFSSRVELRVPAAELRHEAPPDFRREGRQGGGAYASAGLFRCPGAENDVGNTGLVQGKADRDLCQIFARWRDRPGFQFLGLLKNR